MVDLIDISLFNTAKPEAVNEENYQKYRVMQVIGIIGLLIHIAFIFLFYFFDIHFLTVINFFSVGVWLWVLFENHKGRLSSAMILACIEISLHSLCAVSYLGLDSGFHFYLWPVSLLATINPKLNRVESAFIGLFFIVTFAFLEALLPSYSYLPDFRPYVEWLYFTNIIIAGGPMVSAMLVIRIINEKQQEELTGLAIKDELTGLYNRRYIKTILKGKSQLPHTIHGTYCIVIGDVDYFKKINDSFGHKVGDDVLIGLSSLFRNRLRSSDIVGRWGGEEFLIVLSSTTIDNAVMLMNKIRADIAEKSFIQSHPDYKVTMSLGISESKDQVLYSELINRADKNLYAAKASGRNRVVA